jgi:amidase
MPQLNEWSASRAAAAVARGEASAEALVAACLARIRAREAEVGAFQFLDPEAALRDARALDKGPVRGPLHGVPIGVKDIIDTADMPTGWGSPIYRDRRASWDAGCVALCRAAGAVILGKTVTTEFAYFHPGKTRNPANPGHTPGGSSQGSAAAVADRMLPLAFGSQTAGSVIRPAAFCGVIGYKASYGDLDLQGVMGLAPSLDTLGLLVRDLADVQLMRSVLAGDAAGVRRRPDGNPPRIGFARTPHWREAQPATRDLLERTAGRLAAAGARVGEPELPAEFDGLADCQATVMAFEAARTRAHECIAHRERVSEAYLALYEKGRAIPYETYRTAKALAARSRAKLAELFRDFDLLLAPSAPGEAPEGLARTGDPLFNRMWTLLHVPCVTLPAGTGPQGLPLGVQLVGRFGEDAALVADAAWVEERLGAN